MATFFVKKIPVSNSIFRSRHFSLTAAGAGGQPGADPDKGQGSRGTDRNQDTETVGQPELPGEGGPSGDPVGAVGSLRTLPGAAGIRYRAAGVHTAGTLAEGHTARVGDNPVVRLEGVRNHQGVQDGEDTQHQEDVGWVESNQDNTRDNHCAGDSLEGVGVDRVVRDKETQWPCAAEGHLGPML